MKKTLVLKVDPEAPEESSIARAADILKNGGLVAFPTETVYGLAANAEDEEAVAELYKVKKRPRTKPFTVQIADVNVIRNRWGCELTKEAEVLTDKFWPGPLTVILKSANGGKIGFRIPANRIAMSILRKAEAPLYVPSANLNGNKPPVSADEVLKELGGEIDLLVDGGPADKGVESTVVDLTVRPAKILRIGAISREKLKISLQQTGHSLQ